MRRIAVTSLFLLSLAALPAAAQMPGGPPPSVGTLTIAPKPVTESSQYAGRVQAVQKVDLVPRVTGFIAERLFVEGSEVDKGQLLYRLERAPFEADVAAKAAAAEQTKALLRNADIVLNRAQILLNTPAGQRSALDDALANQASLRAQLQANQAQLQASQINLDYTEIHAPVAGKITRSALAVGNVVSPSSGPLASVVSQDPMWVLFPVSVREALALRNRYADKGGFAGVAVKLRLPDGRVFSQPGSIDYIYPTVAANTDTVTLRAVVPNPLRTGAKLNEPGNRDLIDGSFVGVFVEGIQPIQALSVPRAAVLSDQQGSFVYVVDGESKAQIRRVTLGQASPEAAVIASGLAEGDVVIVEGLQRVRPGAPVSTGALAAPAGAVPAKG
jgi:membrane fusion protein (multidrug efflux system)